MATVTYRGWHPEPSVTLSDRPLTPWPGQSGRRNYSWAFPRGVPRPVPAVVAAWLAAVRRREGPWFEVRFQHGEWQQLLIEADGLIPWPQLPVSRRRKRRAIRAWRRVQRKARRRGAHAKIRHFLAWANPKLARAFVDGCRAPVVVGNEAGAERTYDPLDSPAGRSGGAHHAKEGRHGP